MIEDIGIAKGFKNGFNTAHAWTNRRVAELEAQFIEECGEENFLALTSHSLGNVVGLVLGGVIPSFIREDRA